MQAEKGNSTGEVSQVRTSLQDLVSFCAQQNQPEVIEAAVMHMDLASLDLNQVKSVAVAATLTFKCLQMSCYWHRVLTTF